MLTAIDDEPSDTGSGNRALEDEAAANSDTPGPDNFEERMLMLARIDPAEDAKSKAIFSYNVMDIIDPPLELKNPYNPRPVVKSRVRIMRNALLQEGFRGFSKENRIMIVINPSDVNPSCITLDDAAPPVPFRLAANHTLSSLSIIGGQHRRDAVVLIKSDTIAKMTRLRAQIQGKSEILKDFEGEPPETEEATEKMERLENELLELQRELEGHEQAIHLVGPWGVTLLDARE